MKLKAKTREHYLIVNSKLSLSEKVDNGYLDKFSRVGLRGFLKVKTVKKNQLEYSGPIGISLFERFKKPITKYEFFFILEQIVVATQKIQVNGLLLQHVLWDVRHVFINEVTKELQFVYLPLVVQNSSANLNSLIEAVVYSAKPIAEDMHDEYISKFIHFFGNQKEFDSELIEKYIAREDKSVVSTIRKNNVGQSGFMTDKPIDYYAHYNENEAQKQDTTPEQYEDEEQTNLLHGEETGMMSEEEATSLLIEEDDDFEETGLLFEEDETALLCEDRADENTVHYPVLFRVCTEEEIEINKPVFRIGKERSYVDYFVSNNNAVSRSHADLILRDEKVYVKDLNSKNRTYINDEVIQIEVETEVHDGDRLRFANEEFVLHL